MNEEIIKKLKKIQQDINKATENLKIIKNEIVKKEIENAIKSNIMMQEILKIFKI